MKVNMDLLRRQKVLMVMYEMFCPKNLRKGLCCRNVRPRPWSHPFAFAILICSTIICICNVKIDESKIISIKDLLCLADTRYSHFLVRIYQFQAKLELFPAKSMPAGGG